MRHLRTRYQPEDGALNARTLVVVTLLCFFVAAAISYPAITRGDIYDNAMGGRVGDAAQYIRMAGGAPLADVARPYRYRVVTPVLARLVPFLPASIAQFYQVSPDKIIAFKFGVVNLVGLTAAGVALAAYVRRLGFSGLEGIVAVLLFYTAFPVVVYGASPLVDAWAYAFLALGFLCIVTQAVWPLALVFLLGMLTKETTLLLLLGIFFLVPVVSGRWRLVAACVPGLLAFLGLRLLLPGGYGYDSGLSTLLNSLTLLMTPTLRHALIFVDLVMAFGFVWWLAWQGWRHPGPQLRPAWQHLVWLVPVTIIAQLAIDFNFFGRVVFFAFPAIIPLALTGLRHVLTE